MGGPVPRVASGGPESGTSMAGSSDLPPGAEPSIDAPGPKEPAAASVPVAVVEGSESRESTPSPLPASEPSQSPSAPQPEGALGPGDVTTAVDGAPGPLSPEHAEDEVGEPAASPAAQKLSDDDTYKAHVFGWATNEVKSREEALDRWKKERGMRTKLPNLTQECVEQCKKLLADTWPSEKTAGG